MPSILIGRTPYGQQKQDISVSSVSRRHATLTDLGGGRWQLEDIGSTYGTSVNGIPVVTTVVGIDTPIMLADFATSVRDLLQLGGRVSTPPPTPPGDSAPPISIAHLEDIYEDYQEAVKSLVKKKSKAQVMRMLPMQLMMPLALGATGIFLPDSKEGNIIKGAVMISMMALSGLLSVRMISVTSNQADEQFELNQQFQIDYVCPNCKNFFGQAKPYQALLNQARCPHCKRPFLESL